MKNLSNTITISRIFLSIPLLFIKPLTTFFFTIYLLCCLSDVLDGFIARKTNTVTELGSKLDSIADFIFVIIVLFRLMPLIKLQSYIIIWIGIIFIVRCASILFVFLKHKTFAILHTYLNKATGFSLIFIPMLMYFVDIDILTIIICSIATLSSSEEFIIHFTSVELSTDKKGLFF